MHQQMHGVYILTYIIQIILQMVIIIKLHKNELDKSTYYLHHICDWLMDDVVFESITLNTQTIYSLL
eukprot:UN06016